MQAQERELGVFFDTIVVCSVTGSTQAGMIAGFADEAQRRRVLGIDGSATVAQTWEQIARIARRTAEAIGVGRELRDDEIIVLDEWHAGRYGIPDQKTLDAIRLCARLEGILTPSASRCSSTDRTRAAPRRDLGSRFDRKINS